MYILVDNRSRDLADGPFDFSVVLGGAGDKGGGVIGCSTANNVLSVELKSMIMARPQTEHYVILDIEELNNHLFTLDNKTTGSFCVAQFDHAPTCCPKDSVRLIKGDFLGASKLTFDPPLPRLNRLRIRLVKYGGGTFSRDDFLDSTGSPLNGWDRCSLLFHVVQR